MSAYLRPGARVGCGCCAAKHEDDCSCDLSRPACELCQCCADHCDCDKFVCVECKATRLNPPASSDDYDLQGDSYVACGDGICGPCTRRGMEPQYAKYMTDGTDDAEGFV